MLEVRTLKIETGEPPNRRSQYMNLKNAPLQEFVLYWLENVKARTVRAGTLKRLYGEAKALEAYPISKMIISDIKLFDIQEYINQLVDNGYRYTTIAKQRLIVTAPLRYAYQTDLIDKDYSAGVKMPAKETVLTADRIVEAFTDEEQASLRKYILSNPGVFASITEFLLETGLRVGEAQALCWGDIDLRRDTIRVCKTLLNSRPDNKNIVQLSAKTRSSTRIIPLSKRAKEILRERLSVKNGDYIFHREGKTISYSGLIKWFKKACTESNCQICGLHVLRHTFATNCYYKGCNIKILSRLLGHASTSITYNTYINLYGDGIEEMRSIVN